VSLIDTIRSMGPTAVCLLLILGLMLAMAGFWLFKRKGAQNGRYGNRLLGVMSGVGTGMFALGIAALLIILRRAGI